MNNSHASSDTSLVSHSSIQLTSNTIQAALSVTSPSMGVFDQHDLSQIRDSINHSDQDVAGPSSSLAATQHYLKDSNSSSNYHVATPETINLQPPAISGRSSASKVYHTCSNCSLKFRSILSFQIHLRKHSKNIFLKCPQCNSSFSNFSSYRIHLKSCLISFSDTPAVDSKNEAFDIEILPDVLVDVSDNSIDPAHNYHLLHMLLDLEVNHRCSQACLNAVVQNLSQMNKEDYNKFNSKSKRTKFYTQLGIYVPAKAVSIADTKCYYVPLRALLENILMLPLYKEWLTKRWVCNHSNITDACCGRKSAKFLGSQCILMTIYSDDIELTNPLGMKRGKRGKFTVFYISFLNIPAQERSKLKNIFLLAIGESRVLKTNEARSKLLNDFLSNVSNAAEHGLNIKGDTYPCALHSYIGDSLAAHAVAGLKESFNPNIQQQCHRCLTPASQFSSVLSHNDSHPKTDVIYNDQIERLVSSSHMQALISRETGLKDVSLFHTIDYFSSVDDILFDIMHIFLEGIAPKQTALFFRHLIDDKIMSRQGINLRLEQFEFCNQVKKSEYPRTIDAKISIVTKSKNMLVLALHIPLLFGNVIPSDDHLNNFVKLIAIIQMCSSPELMKDSISSLESLISSYLNQFVEIYGAANFSPKFHMMIHLVDQIRQHGPLRHHWAMRYEGKNAVPKSKTHFNYKNMALSLSHFYQVGTAFSLWTAAGIPRDMQPQTICLTIDKSDRYNYLTPDMGLKCSKLSHNSVIYSAGDVVLTSAVNNEVPGFFKICSIHSSQDREPKFLGFQMNNVRYDGPSNSYFGELASLPVLINYSEFNSPFPVYAYYAENRLQCVPQTLPFLPGAAREFFGI